MSVWIHYVDFTGNSDDYSVPDLNAVKAEAIVVIEHGIGYVCDEEIIFQIRSLLEKDWQQAVELYNKHNAVKEFFEYGVR